MGKARKIIVILIILAILGSLFMVVFATASDNADDMLTPSALNPFEYAKAPEELYVFLYRGTIPYLSMDIDTSKCAVNRLYVYNAVNKTVTRISEQEVSAYACTQDALYYATTEQKIYKTDYNGADHEYLYQCSLGTVHNLGTYHNILYFIEEQERLIFLDTSTKNAYNVWTCENLDWVFMLNTTQLIATTVDESDYLYDLAAKNVTSISSIEANNMITQAVLGVTPLTGVNASTRAGFSASSVTQENDITFPLAEYPATIYDSSVSSYYRPLSWFHVNGLEGCSVNNCKLYSQTGECEGFARYAHDAYMHMINNSASYAAWDDNKHLSGTIRFDSDINKIKTFFSSLKTGAYIRYGKDTDATPANGVHSVVFVSQDSSGVWVYECNQSYYENLTSAQIGGHDESYFGCGVHFQYYTFERLKRYHYVLHYINHSFTEAPIYDNTTYHRAGCADCTGYARQKHDEVLTEYVDSSKHKVWFLCCRDNEDDLGTKTLHNDTTSTIKSISKHETTYHCCNGRTALVTHTGTLTYSDGSASQHIVRATCCGGTFRESHVYDYNDNNQLECIYCGRGGGNLYGMEEAEIS